ncbi:MAG: hypothetical protein ABIQ30_13090 [Devosia sp.]
METYYFEIAIFEYCGLLQGNGIVAFTAEEAVQYVDQTYFSDVAFERSVGLVQQALVSLSSVGEVLHHMPDRYAGDYYSRALSSEGFAKRLSAACPPFSTYQRMGGGGTSWLRRALRTIELEVEAETKATVQALPQLAVDSDVWDPIRFEPNDRNSSEAIAELDTAIRQLAADNGFSATYPQERDAIVSHATATLDSVKSGVASRSSIKQNFVAAGKWIVEKFGGSAIGAIGSELIKWGMRLLGLPI